MKSSPPPGLPTWLFILTDLALLSAAAVVAWASPVPLSNTALVTIVSCVLLGVGVGLVPLVLRVERQKNAVLDDRQRALEALAQTVRESAQQVSIATGSLHGIAELARRTLREAEDLPAKLQERVAALQGRLAEADDSARKGLEKELAALRGSELERIEAAVAQIARTAAELTRLEAAAAKQVATLQREAAESTTRLEQAIPAAREASGGEAPVPRKPRRPRRDEAPAPAPEEATAAAGSAEPTSSLPVTAEPIPEAAEPPPTPLAPAVEPDPATPPPEPAAPKERPPEVVTQATPAAPPPDESLSEPPAGGPETPPPALTPRKRPGRRSEPGPQPTLDFGFEESPPAAPGTVERTLTSDGATRLLVTAYIGIGNRLFIRGEGPGLSWERGVPLQFISIGKWRWETGEASGPIRFRLYKNDEFECSLGEQVLDPGYLQELTASF
jgi:hypothetical protein